MPSRPLADAARFAGLIAATLLLAPTPALAHVKWFVSPADPSRPGIDPSLILSERSAILVAVAALALGALYLLQRFAGDPHWPRVPFFRLMAVGAPTLLAVQAAITLVYGAVQPALFVPNIPLPLNPFGLTVAAIELLVAFSLITGVADWLAAIVLMLLVPLSFFPGRYSDTLDMLFWIGIGVVILVIGRFAPAVHPARGWFHARDAAWSARAVAALRVITGLAIMAPGLDEKVWNPSLGAQFLAQNPDFNFMRSVFGLQWFTDDQFVLAAGVVETTIGILLVSGLLTRVVILGMWLPFNIGIPFLPPQELIGHLPIFGIMYFLLVHSAGIAPGEGLDRPGPPAAPDLVPAQDGTARPSARVS
jgi:uncharacterized membrane protein YphA (DoxX/SURF4 family)